MRGIHFALFLVLVLSLAGCGPSAVSTPMTINTSSVEFVNTPKPTKTEIAELYERGEVKDLTSTPSPTLTPEPELQTAGPYLTYFRKAGDVYQLVMMDADGYGRKVITLPEDMIIGVENGQYFLTTGLISPTGQWMAFYTGSAGPHFWSAPNFDEGPFDLTLKLLDLTTGKIRSITSLLSHDYPNNFREAEEQLGNPEITATQLQGTFLNGLTRALAWSPDGRYLAFAGQMDGLSSDLYVYEVKTEIIRRLSSGDQEIQWINWSPDGKWIVHSSVYSVGEGMTFDVYAAALDGSSVRYISTNSLYGGVETWVSSYEYLENDGQNGPGNYGLRLIDLNTGRVTRVWDGAFIQYSISKSGKWLAVAALTFYSPYPYQEDPDGFQSGWQLINLKTLEKTKATNFVQNPPDIFLPAQDGELVPAVLNPGRLASNVLESPDSLYWAIVDEEMIRVFSADLTLLVTTPVSSVGGSVSSIVWRPDSLGLFIIHENEIYCMNILDGSVHLVETDLIANYSQTYIWIKNQ